MSKSKIEWTDETWNPIAGCTKVSSGCKHCYAERLSKRLAAMGQEKYVGTVDEKGRWTGKINFDEKALAAPLRWKKPRMVFVNSMSDLFHEDVPDEFIDRVFDVMWGTPQHTYQILTKRPETMVKFVIERASHRSFGWGMLDRPPYNRGDYCHMDTLYYRNDCGWAISAAEKDIDWRCGHPGNTDFDDGDLPVCDCRACPIGELADTREDIAALEFDPDDYTWVDGGGGVEFAEDMYDWLKLYSRPRYGLVKNAWLGVSIENQKEFDARRPYLEALRNIVGPWATIFLSIEPMLSEIDIRPLVDRVWTWTMGSVPDVHRRTVDWVICGGESGPGARPLHPDWARSIRDQCAAAGVPFFFKQWGDCVTGERVILPVKIRKKDRELDGREWNEMPEVGR